MCISLSLSKLTKIFTQNTHLCPKEGDMNAIKRSLLLIFLLVTLYTSQNLMIVEARSLPLQPQQRYAKIFATLGLECKCCDEEEKNGGCKTTWEGTCSKLQCLPWKQH